LAALTQILKYQKQLNGRNHNIPVNINNECQSPIKGNIWQTVFKKEDQTICCLKETHFIVRNKHWLWLKAGRRFTKLTAPENRLE
jgi:hypothetical protein